MTWLFLTSSAEALYLLKPIVIQREIKGILEELFSARTWKRGLVLSKKIDKEFIQQVYRIYLRENLDRGYPIDFQPVSEERLRKVYRLSEDIIARQKDLLEKQGQELDQ